MNYSTAVFLINDKLRALTAIYEPDVGTALAKREMFKTLDPTIKVGDLLVVPTDTRHKMTVVKVTEVDVDVDYDSPAQVRWVVGKVDDEPFKRITAQEEEAIKLMKNAEALDKREVLRKKMSAFRMDEIKALPITDLSSK